MYTHSWCPTDAYTTYAVKGEYFQTRYMRYLIFWPNAISSLGKGRAGLTKFKKRIEAWVLASYKEQSFNELSLPASEKTPKKA